MLKINKYIAIIILGAVVLLTGCASGLNSVQKREYNAFKYDGVLIEEKDPGTGFAFGFLPGGGSFYARKPGLGVLNLLMWPLSIFWDPISGSDGSMAINYDMTVYHLKREKKKEVSKLERKLTLGDISDKEYILSKNKLDDKYDYL
ncbi:MAG: hypothetical protein AB9Q22_00500 [Candidatus Reddybacter sp.]